MFGRGKMVKNLIAGFFDFQKNFFGVDNFFYKNLVRFGQKPKTIIICCSDSRVDPAILFGGRPGDLFVVRNVANLVPPYQPEDSYDGVSAAIEFGVRDLGVREIVVLGHSFCGGIKALCSHARGEDNCDRDFIKPWIKIAMPVMIKFAKASMKDPEFHEVEKASIVNSIENLRTFPWLKFLEDSGDLKIHGWWFDMERGALWAFDSTKKVFQPMLEND